MSRISTWWEGLGFKTSLQRTKLKVTLNLIYSIFLETLKKKTLHDGPSTNDWCNMEVIEVDFNFKETEVWRQSIIKL